MIPVVDIVRLATSREHGTFGMLRIQKELFCNTLEPADRENLVGFSSIPCGQYRCVRYTAPTYGETFMVKEVTGRSDILFHWGNYDHNSKGCILVGNGINYHDKLLAINSSKDTFRRFMKKLDPYDEFILTVSESY